MLPLRCCDRGPPRPQPNATDAVNAESRLQTPARVEIQDLSLWYGATQALRSVSLTVPERRIAALIGPGGSGKSTLLRCLNRMNDLIHGVRISGECRVGGIEVNDPGVDVGWLRRRVGLIAHDASPFPQSVFDNVAFGPRIAGCVGSELDDRVAAALRRASLWDELKDRLGDSALGLLEGQRRRLCIARALAVDPEVLLLDEPAGWLDPIASARIEELVRDLRQDHTILLATHHLQSAARLSDVTAFLQGGELVEVDDTGRLFSRPRDPRTEDYLTGRTAV